MITLDKILAASSQGNRLWLAMLGTVIGLFLMLTAVQTYFDLQTIIQTDDSNFVSINKKVGLLNMLGGASRFSEADLQSIEDQPFVKQFAPYSSSQFQVLAVVPAIGFQSEFFFEAVPDAFLDEVPSRFKWQEGDRQLPIILSRDYLSLYNFGFAPTRGMPALTQSTIQQINFQIRIRNNSGQTIYFSGRVVGFSDRINSILVPHSFLEFANAAYGRAQSAPAKVILEVENPYSKAFKAFIDDNNYELSSGKLIGDKVGNILNIAIAIIAGIGVVIVFLSLMIFLLNFRLLVADASQDIQRLLQLGYRHQVISRVLEKRFIQLISMTTFVGIIAFALTRWFTTSWLRQQGFELPFVPHYITIIAAVLMILILFLLNIRAIRRRVVLLAE